MMRVPLILQVLGCLLLLMTETLLADPRVTIEHYYVLRNKPVSPFPSISIETGNDGIVNMAFKDITVRNITEDDRKTYFTYFSKTPTIEANFYDNGLGRKEDRIDYAFSLWNGRWHLPTTCQDRFHGGFLVFNDDNPMPFAHMIDGFINHAELGNIMNTLEEDFNNHEGLLGKFKATLQRLAAQNVRGYSLAALDFTGDNVGFFIKDFERLQDLSLLQDTYLHQLSYLGYNWGIEQLEGRIIAEASTVADDLNKIKAYEAMGYYAFKSSKPLLFGEAQQPVEQVELLKPVNPVQATYRFAWLDDIIALDIHMMSYYSTKKTFTVSILQEEDGQVRSVFSKTYRFKATAPFSLLADLHRDFAGKLLWLQISDVDGILEPVLLPLKINIPERYSDTGQAE